MGRKIIQISDESAIARSGVRQFLFFCPGCKCGHSFQTPTWTYNEDPERPTVRASVLTGLENFTVKRCHSFITDGQIQFLDDCHHELKGTTVELPDIPAEKSVYHLMTGEGDE